MKADSIVGALLFAGAVLPAQTTHLVGGPTGLPEIRSAIAIAQPGDILLVEPGDYAFFGTGVGVTIRAIIPGSVRVIAKPWSVPSPCNSTCVWGVQTLFALPPGQSAHVVGVVFASDQVAIANGSVGNNVVVKGDVSFDRCVFESIRESALTISVSSTVHLQECTVRSLGNAGLGVPAMLVGTSNVTAVGCTFQGGASQDGRAEAISLLASRLHASGITAIGGTGAVSSAALRSSSGSIAWISDSTLMVSSGACAFQTVFSGLGFFDRTTFMESGSGCASSTPTQKLLGVERTGSLATGGTFGATFRAGAVEFVGVWSSQQPMHVPSTAATPFAQWLWLEPAQALPVALLLTNASGVASVAWPIPNVPALRDQRIWFQGLAGPDLPLRTSALVGGVVR
ncbi:MAG: hypothetical protein AB8H80_19540 [Planctomycetota bacterium]